MADIDDDQRRLELNRRRVDLPPHAERMLSVRSQARLIYSRAAWITREDLENEGHVAWERAKATYPETAPASGFKAYARAAARHAMLAAANGAIPRALQQLYVAIYHAERDLMAEHGRSTPPRVEEIARKAGVELADVEKARRAWRFIFPDQPPEYESPSGDADAGEQDSPLETTRLEAGGDPQPLKLSQDIVDAFAELSESDQDTINKSWEEPDDENGAADRPDPAERKAAYDAKQRFFNKTVRSIARRTMSDGERSCFVGRYRQGQHRLGPEPSECDAYQKFRSGLREADLLRRIFPDDVLETVTRRYIRRHPIEVIVAARGLTLNRCLADEFVYTQPLVAALDTITIRRRDEFQHAILPYQLSSVRGFAKGEDSMAIAARRGLSADAIEEHLRDALETMTWMTLRHRYLKIVKPTITKETEREMLVRLYCDRKPPTADDIDVVRAIAARAFGLEEQVGHDDTTR